MFTFGFSPIFNTIKGDRIASVDADGVLIVWEVRTGSQIFRTELGPAAANRCCFDSTSSIIAVASAANLVKIVDANDGTVINEVSC